MPANTLTKGLDALASTTLEKVRPVMADNIFKGNPLLFLLYDKRQIEDGGLLIAEPLMYATATSVKYLSGGYDTLDTTAQEGITQATFEWRTLTATISISGDEEAKNSGETAILNLLKAKVAQSEMSQREQIDKDMLQIATAKDASAFLGLDELVQDGTSWTTDTVGGINSGTFTFWRNQQFDAAGAVGDAWRNMLAPLYINCTEGREHPDIAITTKTNYALFEAAMGGQVRVTSKAFDDFGYENILYKGMPVVPDFWCQADLFYMINTNFLRWHVHRNRDFRVYPFQRPVDQDSMIASIITMGQLTTNNRRFQGVAVGVNGTNLTAW